MRECQTHSEDRGIQRGKQGQREAMTVARAGGGKVCKAQYRDGGEGIGGRTEAY